VNDKIDHDWVPVGSLQNKVVLRRSRLFLLGLFLLFSAVAAFLVYQLTQPNEDLVSLFYLITFKEKWLLWFITPFTILGAIGAFMAMFKPPTLTLTRDGFEEKTLRKTKSFKWSDVSEFATVEISAGASSRSYVAFYHQKDMGPINKADPDSPANVAPEAGRLLDNYGAKHKELLSLMKAFRERALKESGEPQKPTLAAFAQYSGSESESPDWQSIKDRGPGYDVGEERAPWLKWGLSTLLLAIISISGLWLMSVMINPDSAPKDKIDLVTAEQPGEETPPPKSADEQAWIAALEKDTLEGYREYIEAFPNGRFVDKAQAEIDKYDDKAWATAEQRNTIAGYEDYLVDWPEGKYASKAKERIDEMKKAIEAEKSHRSCQERCR